MKANLNMEEIFGRKFVVGRDGYYADEKEDKAIQLRINGRGSQHIYAGYADGLFGVWVKGRKRIQQCLAWGYVSRQICGDEATFGFPAEDLPRVAKLIGAKRRKQLKPEHLAKLVEQGKRNFATINSVRKKNRVECDSKGQIALFDEHVMVIQPDGVQK